MDNLIVISKKKTFLFGLVSKNVYFCKYLFVIMRIGTGKSKKKEELSRKCFVFREIGLCEGSYGIVILEVKK